MNYTEVFKEIISITHNDYAGYDEKQGWDHPVPFFKKIEMLERQDNITPQLFMEMVNDYLVDFQDPHMYFLLNGGEIKTHTCGFEVRRYKNALYVTGVGKEKRLPIGTQILFIDGMGIEELSKIKKRRLWEPHPERENWNAILNQPFTIVVMQDNGCTETFKLNMYELSAEESTYTIKSINDNTLLLTLSDFGDVDAITKLIDENGSRLQEYKNLIVDVRNNGGGNSNAFSSLLPYVFANGEKPKSNTVSREFNCTGRNVDLFKQLVGEAEKIADDQATIQMIQNVIKQFEQARGQGFIHIDFSDYISEVENDFEGKSAAPEQIIILSDVGCASAGDDFVEVCKGSSKVTVMGRATMGVMDYSDLVIKNWDDTFSLYYPISRLTEKTNINPLHGKGVHPDAYIPWTPDHIEEDIDLKRALDFIKNRASN